jgi:hypothetical protein
MGLAAAPGRARGRPARWAPALLVAALAVLVAGCASSAAVPTAPAPEPVDPAPVVLQPPTLAADQLVPAPAQPPLLTVTGRIGLMNSGDALAFDAAALDQLGRVRITVYEPWVKQTMGFQGVWLADLLRVARLDPAASTVHVTALDDYQIDLTVDDVMAGGVLVATRGGDGAPIPVQDGGPTRLVFAGGVPAGASADQWIWSLRTIDVR